MEYKAMSLWTIVMSFNCAIYAYQLRAVDFMEAARKWLNHHLDGNRLGLGDITPEINSVLEEIDSGDNPVKTVFNENIWLMDVLIKDDTAIVFFIDTLSDELLCRGERALWTLEFSYEDDCFTWQIEETSPEGVIGFWLSRVFYERKLGLTDTEDEVREALDGIERGSRLPVEVEGLENVWYYEIVLGGKTRFAYIVPTVEE